uniref:Uncharacterized protein n=1 Tax=Equus asinus asinus TaxID=83772 RepID=A0A8C4MCA6_EQUAS
MMKESGGRLLEPGQRPLRSLSRKVFEALGHPEGWGLAGQVTCQGSTGGREEGREEEAACGARPTNIPSPPLSLQMTMIPIPMRTCSSASRPLSQVRLPAPRRARSQVSSPPAQGTCSKASPALKPGRFTDVLVPLGKASPCVPGWGPMSRGPQWERTEGSLPPQGAAQHEGQDASLEARAPCWPEDCHGGCPSASLSPGALPAGDEESEDYQNSASIQQWQESRRVMEQVLREAPAAWAGSPDEDGGEPDYVNGDVAATEA